jgi:hypothetical protein
MTGASIVVDNASAADTVLSVKKRVFALDAKLPVRRQRLVYSLGAHGMEPLADKETLGDAGVSDDGSAELDLVLTDLTAAEVQKLNLKVCGVILTCAVTTPVGIEKKLAISLTLSSCMVVLYVNFFYKTSHSSILIFVYRGLMKPATASRKEGSGGPSASNAE